MGQRDHAHRRALETLGHRGRQTGLAALIEPETLLADTVVSDAVVTVEVRPAVPWISRQILASRTASRLGSDGAHAQRQERDPDGRYRSWRRYEF